MAARSYQVSLPSALNDAAVARAKTNGISMNEAFRRAMAMYCNSSEAQERGMQLVLKNLVTGEEMNVKVV